MNPETSILNALSERGLLLLQDRSLPNLVSIVTGESLKGSWWSHSKAQVIFRILNELSDHPDVVTTKLISGKLTFVHRRFWPELLAVALSKERWQTWKLPDAAKELWKLVQAKTSVQASGPAVKELEKRLLVHSQEVHTESGAHRFLIELWSSWASRVRCIPAASVPEARLMLERAAEGIGAPISLLPWGKRPVS